MKREIMNWVVVLGLVFVFRSFAFGSYYIPSESLVPNLLVGDRLEVSKFAYGYSRHSIFGSPRIFSGRIFAQPIKRGDIAVFKLPRDGETDYIKRIIGLPGDVIEMRSGLLYINQQAVGRTKLEDFVFQDRTGNIRRVAQIEETLPSGRTFTTLDWLSNSLGDNVGPFHVPDGHYFGIGDNRDNSLDSRFPERVGVGFVPAENLVGRAVIILWSWTGRARLTKPSTWADALRLERSFKLLH